MQILNRDAVYTCLALW